MGLNRARLRLEGEEKGWVPPTRVAIREFALLSNCSLVAVVIGDCAVGGKICCSVRERADVRLCSTDVSE